MRNINLFAFPLHLKIPNGYWDQLYGGIARERPDIVLKHNDFMGLARSWRSTNVVHLHWPSILYASKWRVISLIKFVIRIGIITLSKLRGDRIIWTVHNMRDHEGKNAAFDALAQRFLARYADAVIVHSPAGVEFLAENYRRANDVYVIPHPNYVGFHGPRLSAPDPSLRAVLDLKENDKVFLSFGSIRPYKNLEQLISLFNNLPDRYILVIAGKSFYQSYLAALRALVKKNNVCVVPHSIPNEDIPRYFSLVHASLFAFKEVLTSGSMLLSLSYGVPAIVPKRGDMPSVIKDGVNGFLYKNGQELDARIRYMGSLDNAALLRLQESTLRETVSISLDAIVHATLGVYGI
ncbi:MAG: glycosyltransferase family 4 protein [Patescibacteria group bacterium]